MVILTRGTLPQQAEPLPALPPHLLSRLAEYGIRTIDDWRTLGRRRYQLFGITRALVRQIDAAASKEERT